MGRLAICWLLVVGAVACGDDGNTPPADARSWVEADALFHRDARWLGADAAYSVDLGDDRVLWLFGDTFVANTTENVRTDSEMVRNTVALQRGRDPVSAAITFHWRTDSDGSPASFFAEDGALWHWPGGAARMPGGGPLVMFLSILRATPGEGLGFAGAGWRLAVVDDPSGPPDTWTVRIVDPPTMSFDAVAGSAVAIDGDQLVALATRFDGVHAGYLVRWSLAAAAAGDFSHPEWWADARGWVAQDALGGAPAVVIPDAGPESSIHHDVARGEWLHVASYGFGASTIGVRRAPRLTGPWSEPRTVFEPPESRSARPFVYAAKAHQELDAPAGMLAITYATNTFDFGELFRPEGAQLYWPRFVLVSR